MDNSFMGMLIMKRCPIFVVLLSVALTVLTGCSKRAVDDGTGGVKYPVRFACQTNVQTSQAGTKVTGQNFDEGDVVGIYSFPSDDAMFGTGEFTHGNVPYVYQTEGELLVQDGWTPIYFPLDEALPLTFIGYYPYTDAMSADGVLKVDLTDQTTGTANAILYSNNAQRIVRTADYVTMEFRYLMAQVIVNITFDVTDIPNADLTDITSVTFGGTGIQTVADFYIEDGSLLTGSDASTTGYQMVPGVERTVATILPQYVTDPTITVVTPYHTFVARPTAITYEAGLQYTYNLTLRSGGEVVVGNTVIEEWVPGNSGMPPIIGEPEIE